MIHGLDEMLQSEENGSTHFCCEKCEKHFKTESALNMHNYHKHGIKTEPGCDDDRFTEADYQTWVNL